jgi:enediyne biosynthesis protein E4
LPNICQVSPVNSILVDDFNGDGYPDVVLLGNKFEAEVETVRYDSGFGVLLLGNKAGELNPVSSVVSGLYLDLDIKSAVLMQLPGKKAIVTLPKHGHLMILTY